MSLAHLQAIRLYEIELIVPLLTPGQRLLEIGAGAGWQAQALTAHGFRVTLLDVLANNYQNLTTARRSYYDGRHLPIQSHSVDVVYSSNVLEHIRPLEQFQVELRRVLKPDGLAIHVLPTVSWRFWTLVAFYLHKLREPNLAPFPERHGERGTAFSELRLFSAGWWCAFFRRTGWTVEAVLPNRLFYTGYSLLDRRLPLPHRRRLSRWLGSSSAIYVLR